MQQPVVRVGEWLVTPSINQISRNGRQLTLEPRLIDLLVFFAQHSGEVLSRDELIDNVWKRSIVTNHVVTQSISELRKSLKDNDEDSPVYIATVPKRGYKLMVPVIWYSEEEGEEIMLSSPPPIPEAVPATDSPSHSLNGFAPIFPDTCYHLTHYWLAAVDIPVASDNPVHYADAIRYNARTPLQGSLLPLTRLVWA
ncbi:cadBA operon transcriptional activator [Escherichia coli]|nr:cadBA operon transcriptional activator [Escherichia coli]